MTLLATQNLQSQPYVMKKTSDSAPTAKQRKDKLFEDEMFVHIDALYNFAYKLTMNEDDANDLVQDSFVKAYRFLDYFQQGTNAKAWLFRIVKNSFINDYRKKVKKPHMVDYTEIQGYTDTSEYEGYDYEDNPLREPTKATIVEEGTKALNQLPAGFRMLIILSDIEDFSYEEMAGILDIPVGTVRSRLHRARKALKVTLNNYAEKMGYRL